jgi:non-ribosomal peptide synthetase component F
MSIEMIGAVYCPLAPGDPDQRLDSLIKQTQSQLILVHWMTQDKFESDHMILDIETVVNENIFNKRIHIDELSKVVVTGENIAYVIFTSGSTGVPKAVRIALLYLVGNKFVAVFPKFYFLFFNFCSTTSCQLYMHDFYL